MTISFHLPASARRAERRSQDRKLCYSSVGSALSRGQEAPFALHLILSQIKD